MKHRLPLALSALALVVALLSNGSIVAASSGVVRHALFADRALVAGRADKAKRAKLADTAKLAKRATLAQTAITARNALAVNGLKASATASPGALYPLGSDGRFPTSVLPLPQPVVARVERSTAQTIPVQVAFAPVAKVSFTTADFESGGRFFDPAHPTVMTIPVDGYYLVTGQVTWQTQNRGLASTWGFNRAITIFANDGAVAFSPVQGPPAEDTRQVVDLIWPLKAGDTLSLGVGHDNAGDLDIDAGAALTAIRIA